MAITQSNYLGNGSTTSFAFTFNYLSTADVKVSINGTLTTAWVFTGPQTILFGTAPASGAAIRIFRDTQIEVLEATISSGGAIKASDLNDNFTQSLHALQEIENNGGGSGVPGPGITDGNKTDITVSNGGATWTINNGSVSGAKINGTVPMTGLLNMGDYRITNLAAPVVETDAVTKAYADSLAASALSNGDKGDITVSNNGDTWTIDNGAVTAAKIATDTITGTQIAANAIGASELANDAVDTAAIANLAVTTDKLADLSVTAGKIAADTITAAQIAPNAVGASELADDAVDTAAIANLAVTTAKLADLSVTAGKIAADTITAAQIAPNAVGASELADDAVDTAAIANLAVTTAKLADLSVTAGKIANDTITSAQIATDAVGSAELADNAVDTAAIANLAVTTAKLADLSVTAGKIANDAVGTAAIANLAVTTAKLADLSVTAGKIANDTITATQIAPNAVGASELADDAVDTAAIVNLAVTTAKLADLSVTAGKIAADTITAAQIAPNAVGASELADDSVDTAAIINGAVTGTKIANATITATQIAADTITAAQIAPNAVGASELADNAVDTAAIANLAVTTDKLADFAVTAAKIATDTITNAQIGPGAVGASELAANSVDTANIINSAVTEAKIANDAVTASKIAANAVGASELADDAVDTAAIANLAVTTNKLADLSVTAGKIANDTITASQIAPNAVGASELADNSVDTAAIVAGAVTGPKIDGTVPMTGLLNMGNFKITSLASPTASSDAATRGFVESFFGTGVADGDKGDITVTGAGATWTIDAGAVTGPKINGTVAMTGLLNMGNFKVTNLATPTASTDAATKGFVESFVGTGVSDGDKGDITVASGGTSWTIDSGVITAGKIANETITAAQIAPNAIGSSELADNSVDTGAIVNGAVTAAKTTATPNNTANELVSRSASGNIDVSSINGSPIGVRRNRILNGDFAIQQRDANATADGQYGPDRWKQLINSSGAIGLARQYDSISLFSYYGLVSVSALDSSISSNEYALIEQSIEGTNSHGIGFVWGTALAKTVTLSFLVRSNITGTFCVALRNNNFTRTYLAEYTINTANTYEQKVITIPGDTAGDWNPSVLAGIRVGFTVACGSTFYGTNNSWNAGNFLATSNQTNLLAGANELRITNVQLEAGSVATPFEKLSWEESLPILKRYYQTSWPVGGSTGKQFTLIGPLVVRRLQAESQTLWFNSHEVEMRVAPTMTWYSPGVGTAGAIRNTSLGTNVTVTGNSTVTIASGRAIQGVTHASEGSLGHIILGHYIADAEI